MNKKINKINLIPFGIITAIPNEKKEEIENVEKGRYGIIIKY